MSFSHSKMRIRKPRPSRVVRPQFAWRDRVVLGIAPRAFRDAKRPVNAPIRLVALGARREQP
jgi:hypothetical protein